MGDDLGDEWWAQGEELGMFFVNISGFIAVYMNLVMFTGFIIYTKQKADLFFLFTELQVAGKV